MKPSSLLCCPGQDFNGPAAAYDGSGEDGIPWKDCYDIVAAAAGDGYRLWVDGTLVIDDWAFGSYRLTSTMVDLDPGIYPLLLEYFEGTTQARLSFTSDLDIIE